MNNIFHRPSDILDKDPNLIIYPAPKRLKNNDSCIPKIIVLHERLAPAKLLKDSSKDPIFKYSNGKNSKNPFENSKEILPLLLNPKLTVKKEIIPHMRNFFEERCSLELQKFKELPKKGFEKLRYLREIFPEEKKKVMRTTSVSIKEKVKNSQEIEEDNKKLQKYNRRASIRNSVNFVANANVNSSVVHEIRTNWILNKFCVVEDPTEKLDKVQEEMKEERDTIVNYNLEELEWLRYLKKYTTGLNMYCINIENFGVKNNMENKVNFFFDFYSVPTFKNTFINHFKQEPAKIICQYKNFIDPQILGNLNLASIKKQYEIDHKKEIQEMKKKKKIEYDYLKEIENTYFKDDGEHDEDLLKKEEEERIRLKKKNIIPNNLLALELETYFWHKYMKYEGVGIANGLAIEAVYNRFPKE